MSTVYYWCIADHAATGSIPDVYFPMTNVTNDGNNTSPSFTLWYTKDGVEQTSKTIFTDTEILQIEGKTVA